MTIVLHYTESVLKGAIWNFIKRVYFKKMVGLSIIAIGVLISALFLDSPWLQAFTVVPVAAIPAMLGLGYWYRIRESLKKLALLDNGNATMTLSESGVALESEIGKSELKWKTFTELWEFQTNYLLLFTDFNFLTLPKDQVPPEFVAFIKEHLNGKVQRGGESRPPS